MLVHFFAATLQLWHTGGIRLWQLESQGNEKGGSEHLKKQPKKDNYL